MVHEYIELDVFMMFKTGAINELEKNYIDKLIFSKIENMRDHVAVSWGETRDIRIVAELEFRNSAQKRTAFVKNVYSLFIQNTLDL